VWRYDLATVLLFNQTLILLVNFGCGVFSEDEDLGEFALFAYIIHPEKIYSI